MGKDNFKELYEEACSQFDNGNLFKADKLIKELKKENQEKENEGLLILEGKYFKEINNFNKAFDCFNRALETNDDNEECLYERGKLFSIIGKKEESYNDLKKSYDLDNSNENVMFALGRMAVNLGKHEEARELFRVVYHYIKNDDVSNYFTSANRFIIDELERKEELNIEDKLSLAKSKFYTGELEEAEEVYKSLGEINSADGLLNYSYLIKNLYEAEQGIKYVDKAIELEPENPRTYLYKGILLEEMGRLEEALKAHEKAKELNEKYKPVYNRIMSVLNKLGRYQEVFEIANKIEEGFNYDKEIFYNSLAEAYYNTGNVSEALNYVDKSIELCSNYPEANLQKSRILRECERYRDAMDVCNNIIDFGYNGELIAVEKALILRSVEQYEGALDWLEWYLDNDKDAILSNFIKATCLMYLKQSEEALSCMDKVIYDSNKDIAAYGGKMFLMSYEGNYSKEEYIDICGEALVINNIDYEKKDEILSDFIKKYQDSISKLKYDKYVYDFVLEKILKTL